MRVFISSTVYDLLDIRAEVSAMLKEIGATVLMSDDQQSDFTAFGTENSIETCLSNLRTCDVVIIILDKRYGPRLGKAGFEDVSATHLEYKEAIKENKNVLFYIRDRLDGDYSIWRKPGDSPKPYSWIIDKDEELFKLIDERISLDRNLPRSNWYWTFKNSIDLKSSIRKQIHPMILPFEVREMLGRNEMPLLGLKVNSECKNNYSFIRTKLICEIKNVGGSPALSFFLGWEGNAEPTRDKILGKNQAIQISIQMDINERQPILSRILTAEYETWNGVRIVERFEISAKKAPTHDQVLTYGSLIDRKYYRVEPKEIVFEN